jgi:hypothetical protein
VRLFSVAEAEIGGPLCDIDLLNGAGAMTSSENKKNTRQPGQWAAIYMRIAGAFGLLVAFAAGVAALTGGLSFIGQFAKSVLYPVPQLVLSDSRFVGIQDERDALHSDPLTVITIAIETVVERKSGSGVQGCYAQLLNAGGQTIQ